MKHAAVLLTGGFSRRMGSDKALLPWRGSVLLDHQADILRATEAAELILACRSDQSFALPDFRKVTDAVPGAGPMAALADIWTGTTAEILLVLAVDMPFVPAARLRELAGLADRGGCTVVTNGYGRYEPLAAAWHRSCLPAMRRALAAGQRSIQPLCTELLAAGLLRPVASGGVASGWLANLNRPADLVHSAHAASPSHETH